MKACVTIGRAGYVHVKGTVDDLVRFSRLSALSSAPCSKICLHMQASPTSSFLDGCLFLADLTQDCMDLREGNIFPGSSPVIAENIERDSGLLIPDHLTHNSGDMSSSPGADEQKRRKPLYFIELCFLYLVRYKQ